MAHPLLWNVRYFKGLRSRGFDNLRLSHPLSGVLFYDVPDSRACSSRRLNPDLLKDFRVRWRPYDCGGLEPKGVIHPNREREPLRPDG